VIWSEADALSGTDVTNPTDYRFHWNHFESNEDLRENLRMVKLTYILPDFLKTANNELELFWIPGDWEHGSIITNTSDARSPYDAPVALNAGYYENQVGESYRNQLFGDNGAAPMTTLGSRFTWFFDLHTIYYQNKIPNSLSNSEGGARYSTLLPIGNGLQTSLIWLYEARSDKEGFCLTCGMPAGATALYKLGGPPGSYLLFNVFDYGPPSLPTPPVEGTLRVPVQIEYVRENYFDMTGTYYDKDLTDMVYRYDFLYSPKIGSAFFGGSQKQPSGIVSHSYYDDSDTRWTEFTRWIVAADRPTYIPWISKQHTFFTVQNTVTWYPDRHDNAVPYFPTDVGKLREISNFFFLAATNWLMNGQWTAQNVWEWDWDNNCGAFSSTNSYRYSENVLFGLNAVWYVGRSGRFTDPYALSRGQRYNELEFRFTYEL